jgi:CHAT domain-containing protein
MLLSWILTVVLAPTQGLISGPIDTGLIGKLSAAHTLDDKISVLGQIVDDPKQTDSQDKIDCCLYVAQEAISANAPTYAAYPNLLLSNLYFEEQDYERATYYAESALPVLSRIKDADVTGTLRLLVTCAGYDGDPKRSQRYGMPLIQLLASKGMKQEILGTKNDMAFAYGTAGRAKEEAQQYRALLQEIPKTAKDQRSQTQYNLAEAERELGQTSAAINHFLEAERLGVLPPALTANAECFLGEAFLANHKPAKAITHFKKSLDINGKLQDADSSIDLMALSEIVLAYKDLKEPKKANQAEDELNNLAYESTNTELVTSWIGVTGFGSSQSSAVLFGIQIANSIAKGQYDQALFAAETAKARGLIDLRRRIPIDPRKLQPEELTLWNTYRQRFHAAFADRMRNFQKERPTNPLSSANDPALKISTDDLDDCERRLKADLAERSPDTAIPDEKVGNITTNGVAAGSNVAAAEWHLKIFDLLKDLKSLPPDTIIADTVMIHWLHKSEMDLFLVWSDGKKAHVSVSPLQENGAPVSLDRLTSLCSQFASGCMSGSGRSRAVPVSKQIPTVANDTSGKALYHMLFQPIAKVGRPFRRLIFGPDGPLWKVPIQCLPVSASERVIDRWEVDYCYSAEQYLLSREEAKTPPDPSSVLAIGNLDYGSSAKAEIPLSSLPGSAQELSEIKSICPKADLLTGSNATPARVSDAIPAKSIVHFATHALMIDDAPNASALALSNASSGADGFLTASEIAAMKLNTRLAVLAACDSGRGVSVSGEGLIGLSYAFISAGCPSVVASLWPVDDRVSPEFMETFYKELAASRPIGQALRTAALKVKASHPQPYFWGPFMLIGDYGN